MYEVADLGPKTDGAWVCTICTKRTKSHLMASRAAGSRPASIWEATDSRLISRQPIAGTFGRSTASIGREPWWLFCERLWTLQAHTLDPSKGCKISVASVWRVEWRHGSTLGNTLLAASHADCVLICARRPVGFKIEAWTVPPSLPPQARDSHRGRRGAQIDEIGAANRRSRTAVATSFEVALPPARATIVTTMSYGKQIPGTFSACFPCHDCV